MKTTAKKIRATAASVRGARSAGIETQASAEAPAILAAADRALARMGADADPMAQSGNYARAAAMYDGLKAARDELAEVLS